MTSHRPSPTLYPYMSCDEQLSLAGRMSKDDVITLLDYNGDSIDEAGWNNLTVGSAYVRAEVAGHPLVPTAVRAQLAKDRAKTVRQAADVEVAPLDACTNVKTVLRYVTSSWSTPAVARAASTKVVANANAFGPHMSPDHFRAVASSIGVEVTAAAFAPEFIPNLVAGVDPEFPRQYDKLRAGLSHHTVEQVHTWASSKVERNARVGAILATDPQVLATLTHSKHAKVRQAAGLNPDAPAFAVAVWLSRSEDLAEDVNEWLAAGGRVEDLAEGVVEHCSREFAEWLVVAGYDEVPPLTGRGASKVIEMLSKTPDGVDWGRVVQATPTHLIAAMRNAKDPEDVAGYVLENLNINDEVVAVASTYTEVSESHLDHLSPAVFGQVGVRTVRDALGRGGNHTTRQIAAAKLGEVARTHSWRVVRAQLSANWAENLSMDQFTTHLSALLADKPKP